MTRTKKDLIFSICVKATIIVVSWTGILLSFYWPTGYMVRWRTFLYFTVQSNAIVSAFCLLEIIFELAEWKTQKAIAREWLYVCKHVGTLLMIITFVTFYGMFAAGMVIEDEARKESLLYLARIPSNFTVHFISPTLTVVDYLLFDEKLSTKHIAVGFLSLIYPVVYAVSTLLLSFSGQRFSAELAKVPYFFLDYETFGWFAFSENGLGIVYQCVLLGVAVYFLNYLLFFIKAKVDKRRGKVKAEYNTDVS